MLPRLYRLTKERDFAAVKKSGKPVYNRFFKLVSRKNGLQKNRCAVVVSAKISKKAVVRNRLRRQCLEIIRLQLPRMQTGFDFILWTGHASIDQDYQTLETNLLHLLKKSGLLT